MIDENKQDVITIGKMVIYKNALIYENSVIQISNICSIWVADHSYVIRNQLPTWIKAAGTIGALCTILGIANEEVIFILSGLALAIWAIIGFTKYKPTTPISKYALGIERASGRIKLFTASDQNFVKKMARTLMESMSQDQKTSEKVIMNIDNKSINIENAENSNIIGGDVVDSLVESLVQ